MLASSERASSALAEAELLYSEGADNPADFEAAIRNFISREPLATVEVAAVRDPETLKPLPRLQGHPVLVALFVRIGTTRLLDNRVIGANNDNNRERIEMSATGHESGSPLHRSQAMKGVPPDRLADRLYDADRPPARSTLRPAAGRR